MRIPVVDFSKCGLLNAVDEDLNFESLRQAGTQLYEAFSTAGFAYISHAGISSEMIYGVNDVARAFFQRPLEYKKNFCSKGLGMCYDPLGAIRLNRKRPFDYQEGLRVAPYEAGSQWPDVTDFKKRVTEFKNSCETLLLRILRALGVGMKLKNVNLFSDSHQLLNKKGNDSTIKLIYYPPVTDDTKLEEDQLRVGEHSDFGSITLLFHDAIGGLQVQTPEGEYIDAPCIPDAILLNIGDMMQFWSGGRLKSTLHRVVWPDPEKILLVRQSITYFGTVDEDVVLDELEFEDSETQSSRNTVVMTSKEYLLKRFREAYHY